MYLGAAQICVSVLGALRRLQADVWGDGHVKTSTGEPTSKAANSHFWDVGAEKSIPSNTASYPRAA